jgi:prepilin-type N-terminal cleavage/methylation domain-containing protein
MTRRALRSEEGFTLVEVMIAVVIGVIVLMAATGLALVTGRSLVGTRLRDGITRNSRYVALSLQRDLEEAGVGVESQTNFGTVGVWNDTLVILRVPYNPNEAAVYNLVPPPPPPISPLAPGGTCGATCLDIANPGGFQLAVGDIARLQVNAERRLLYISAVNPATPTAQITFVNLASLLHHNGALSGGLLLTRSGTFVQELSMVAYWRDAQDNLLRAESVSNTGAMQGEIIATGVQQWDVSLVFTNGVEAVQADGLDADPNNDYDDIGSVHVRARVRAENADPRVNGGALITRNYDWWFTPRNLIYERNRLGP